MIDEKNLATSDDNMAVELDPVEQLRELKANYVPKEQLEQAIADRNRYFQMATTNYQEPKPVEEEKVDINELRKDLFNNRENLSNLEFARKALKLRSAIIDNGGVDPFIPQGRKITATTSDRYAAERVAEGLQYCVD